MDEENWNATHRFSGKLWMASGILCMLCGLFGESMAALVVYIISIMAAAIISILYSYLFYKKKLATGEGLKIQYNTKKSVIYLIIAISTIVFTIWTLFCGSIQVRCNCRTIMVTELMVLETWSMLWETSKTISSEIISATLMPPAIHMLSWT